MRSPCLCQSRVKGESRRNTAFPVCGTSAPEPQGGGTRVGERAHRSRKAEGRELGSECTGAARRRDTSEEPVDGDSRRSEWRRGTEGSEEADKKKKLQRSSIKNYDSCRTVEIFVSAGDRSKRGACDERSEVICERAQRERE
jgi:hypothetical protein